jgi:hypothetical protein
MSSDPCCAASLAHKADLAAQHHVSPDFEKAAQGGGYDLQQLHDRDPIKPSFWRSAIRNTARMVGAVSIAKSE